MTDVQARKTPAKPQSQTAKRRKTSPGKIETDAPIVVRGLVNRFGDHTVHDQLDLTVERGQILGVVGGSGTGKTVLMRAIIGLQKPSDGDIFMFGQRMDGLDAKAQRTIQARTGILFQSGALYSALTVAENIMTPILEFTKLSRDDAYAIALLKLSLVGLPLRAADLFPSELSGGMIKRAGLARALALDPELLFLDEPTAGLDPIGAAAFDDLIRELAKSLDLTVFMITHDLDSLYAICDQVAVLADKKVVAVDTVEALEDSTHPWIHEYFNGPRSRAGNAASGEGKA